MGIKYYALNQDYNPNILLKVMFNESTSVARQNLAVTFNNKFKTIPSN
jgi:hypothetical protein